jgi:hypothetical protein
MKEHSMKPREIPFERCVKPMVDDPIEMRWRLDFADWLLKNGHKDRAYWFRSLCILCENRMPLAGGYYQPRPIHANDLYKEYKWLKDAWLKCQPEYWNDLDRVLAKEGILQQFFFGRVIISAGAFPENHFSFLGELASLVPAFHDGWLERLDCMLLHTDQVKSLLAWPESHRALPLHIDTIRCQAEGPFDDFLRELLCLEGLHGITLGPEEVSCPCTKRFSDLAKNIRFLSLLSMRKTGPSFRLLEQLRHLPELRVLTVGVNLPADDHIEHLTAIPKLQMIYLCGRDLTDKGLLAVAQSRSLRTVFVTSLRVTRDGIYALREARPDLRVVAIDDTLGNFGPV